MAPSVEAYIEGQLTADSANEQDVISVGGVVYISVMLSMLTFVLVMICIKCASLGQKTRNPQQRRMYTGSRARPSLTTHEPTIYVSPSNLPPPPKYECMAPPSYEEVVGVHYPNLQAQQPIAQPITTALAQTTQPNNTTRTNDPVPTSDDSVPATNLPVPATNFPVPTTNDSITTVNERQTTTSS